MEKKRFLMLGGLPLLFALVVGANVGSNPNVIRADAATEPWAFDNKQDVLIDSFYNDTVKRELSVTGATDSGFSYAHSSTANAEASADNAIYKYASGVEKKDSTLYFEVKIDNEVDLAKLHFNVRGGGTGTADAWSNAPVSLLTTINEDGLANGTITKGAWTTISISLPNTFAGAGYTGGGTASISILGFSLYGESTNTGYIDIRKVSVDTSVVDNFNRLGHEQPAGAYWSGFDGVIIKRFVTLTAGSYTFKNGTVIDKENAIVSLKGDLTGMSVALVDASGVTGTPVAFVNLKDRTGGALPTTLASYTNVDINLAGSGLTTEFGGLMISSTTELMINNFFASDCITKETETLYRGLDLDNVSYVNDFNFTASGPYSTSYSEAPAAFKAHGINFIAGYASADGVTFDGQDMVIPALTAEQSYGSLFMGMARDPEIKDYVVIQVKAEGGADFQNLRFNFYGSQTNAIWLKDAYAGFGLATLEETNYPYVDDNGYSWLMLKVEENELLDPTKLNGEINVYWGHKAGTIKINSIFYADAAPMQYTGTVFNDAPTAINGYVYMGYIEAGVRYLELEFVGGTGGGRTNTLALEQAGLPSKYLKDGQLIGVDGQPLVPQEVADGQTLIMKIDLVLSGYDTSKGEHYHSHWYDMGEVVVGSLSLNKRTAYKPEVIETELIAAPVTLNPISAGTGYAYLGNFQVGPISQHGDVIQLVITSDATVVDAMKDMRLEFSGLGVKWFSENAEGTLRDPDGQPMNPDLSVGDNTFTISLKKTGLDPFALTGIYVHFHGTNNTATNLNLTLKSVTMLRDIPAINMSGLPTPDYAAPVITSLATDKLQYALDETVTLTTTVTDNVTTLENLVIEYTVSIGDGDDYQELTVTNGTFKTTIEGTYTISVVVTDEAGNSATTTIQLVVEIEDPVTSEPTTSTPTTSTPTTSTPPTSEPVEPTEPGSLGTGEIVAISAGAVILVGLIGYGVYYFFGKKPK